MAKNPVALEFKSATLYALRAVLYTHDTAAIIAALDERMQDAGAFYENEPVVIDAQALEEAPDWHALDHSLRRHHLYPIGVQAAEHLRAGAQQDAGLAPLEISTGTAAPSPAAPTSSSAADPSAPRPKASAKAGKTAAVPTAAVPAPHTETLVIRHPLRSGQRIYAKGCDLIVLGMVSQGAEVIADGHIHVYGPLRGKAMAGAHGRTDAMILTTQLDPELLAIAGVYRVIETRLPDTLHNQAAQVLLDGETLRIRALDEPNEYL